MCFLSSAVMLTLFLSYVHVASTCQVCQRRYHQVLFKSPAQSYVSGGFFRLCSLELTLKSPMKLNIFSKMILDSLMMLSLLAYTFESMSAEAWLVMHTKHLARSTFYIPPQCLCLPLTIRVIWGPDIRRSAERPWRMELVTTSTRVDTWRYIFRVYVALNILFCYWNENIIVLDISGSHLKITLLIKIYYLFIGWT